VIGGIATGVALITSINIINKSVLINFHDTIESIAGPADLQVTLSNGEVGFSEDVIEAVRANSLVAAAVPLVHGTVTLADEPTQTLQLFGADLFAEEDLARYRIRLATARREAAEALLDPDSIFVTRAFAIAHGLGVGKVFRLSTPVGVRRLTVRGLLDQSGVALAYGGQLAVRDIAAAQELLAKPGRVDQIDIVLGDRAAVSDAQSSLEASLPSVLTVGRPELHGAQYERVLSSFQAMLTGLSSLCLIAALFIIYNTTLTAAIERARTIAHLRLIGVTRRQLFRLLTLEAFILGAIGALLGIGLGIPLAWLLSGTITTSMGVIFQLRFPLQYLSAAPSQLIMIAGVGTAVAVFASSFAARRMATLDPLEALQRGSHVMDQETPPRRLCLLWAGMLAASVLCFLIEDRQKSIAWGNAGSTLWNASVIVIAIPLMRWLSAGLSQLLPQWFGAEGHVAAGSLCRAGGRSGVTVAAIALILTIATLLSSLVLSCRESLASYFAGFFASDLTVSAVSTEGGWLETPLSPDVEQRLAALSGVSRVSTARVLPGQSYRGARIALLALSPSMFEPERVPPGWYREGNPARAAASLRSGRAVDVSVSMAERYDIHAGDIIELQSPTGTMRLPVVGVVPDYVSDRGSVIMSRDVLSKYWQENGANRFLISVAPGVSIKYVREEIQGELGATYRLKTLSTKELLQYHTDQIDRAFAVMNSIQLLIIIVTIAGIFDLLLARIMERRRELALWQVIGATRSAVRRSVVLESMTLGTVGALLGAGVGLVTTWVWIAIHFRELLGYYVEYHFAVGALAWYVALVLVMTLVAGYAAASRATKESILDGIRNE